MCFTAEYCPVSSLRPPAYIFLGLLTTPLPRELRSDEWHDEWWARIRFGLNEVQSQYRGLRKTKDTSIRCPACGCDRKESKLPPAYPARFHRLEEIFGRNSNGVYDKEALCRPVSNLCFGSSFLTLSLHGFSIVTFHGNLFSQAPSSKPRSSIDEFISIYSSSFSSLWRAVENIFQFSFILHSSNIAISP